MVYNKAIVKFNGGKGALLCNHCDTIIATGLDHEDVEHQCSDGKDHPNTCRCEVCRFWS